ncbi:MAG: TetR/AcrR family transcriptional regulator [Desulfobacteraceae bacterium]|jgi:AcrR family transcriptional regulator
MKQGRRMSAEERRQAIIDVAKPLFAEKGFNGTSVRLIAERAQVSEALLYKHFPSKKDMYKEILTYSQRLTDLTIKDIEGMEPSVETLVFLVYMLFQVVLNDIPGEEGHQKSHERLLFYSLLEDVDYASMVFKKMHERFHPVLLANYNAAVKSGDLPGNRAHPENLFWFAHHLAMALNLCHLSNNPAFPYETSREELADEAVRFALRGIGLSDEIIASSFKPKKMDLYLKDMLFGL